MVCGTFKVEKIPDDEVDEVVERFETNVPPPTSVTKSKQADGTWTVIATWPPCPDNTTHTTDSGG